LIHYYSEFGRKLEKATEGSFGYDLVATEDGQIPGGKRGIFGTGIYLDADNLEEMVYNVKTYLEELMEVINRPMKECECCDGYGVVSIDTVKEK
jgi:dUTPase